MSIRNRLTRLEQADKAAAEPLELWPGMQLDEFMTLPLEEKIRLLRGGGSSRRPRAAAIEEVGKLPIEERMQLLNCPCGCRSLALLIASVSDSLGKDGRKCREMA